MGFWEDAMRFWEESRRRKVARVAGAYAVVAWLLVEVSATVEPALGLPEWFDTLVVVLLALGFFLAVVLAWAFELTPGGVRKSSPDPDPGSAAPGGLVDGAILVALVALLAFAGFRATGSGTGPAGPDRGSGPADGGSSTPPGAVASVEAGLPSVAVLPFSNLSSDPEQEFFSDGLSDELISHLARLDGLRVAGRTSAFAFKDRRVDARTIGAELGVAHLLEGSVRRAGNRLRIAAALVSAADGLELWSGSFDRELDDVFRTQEEIAAAVAEALSVTLAVGRAGAEGLGTKEFEAYEAYLRGQSLYYQAGMDPGVVPEALASYERAVTIDPDFGRAWIGLANASLNLGLIRRDWRARSAEDLERAASRLFRLAPDAWETWVFQAYRRQERWDWVGAERAFAEAARRGPSDPGFWADAYGAFLGSVGRVREAAEVYGAALEEDPLSMYLSWIYAMYLNDAGEERAAREEYRRSAGLEGSRVQHETLHLTRLILGRASRAEIDAQFARVVGEDSLSWLGRLAPVWEDRDRVLEAIRGRVVELRATNPSSGALLSPALWASLYGDVDLALEVMREGSVEARRMWVNPLWLPAFAAAREAPRFRDLVRDLGLVDYWRTTGTWGDFCRPLGEDDFTCR